MVKKALITGSSGLVGSEAAKLLLSQGWKVYGVDNDTRKALFGEEASTEPVREWLVSTYPNFVSLTGDIRNNDEIKEIFRVFGEFDLIIHAAAQPAHDWATDNALADFQINAWGTMVMLEHYRRYSPDAVFIHVSTSKVYGDYVNDLPLKEFKTRFDLTTGHKWYNGVDESMKIDGSMHSLFGASKASGDIMAHEYGKYLNLPIAIFRPVCITGSAHKGAKLHGYLSYLVKCINDGTPYIINGYKGKQVRDNIHAADLAKAFLEVYKDRTHSYGEFYNIGGGRRSNNSMIEAIGQIESLLGKRGNISYSEENRRGDHKWCIFSSSKFQNNYPNWDIEYDNDRILEELCEKAVIEK